jgi:hypothetical protein
MFGKQSRQPSMFQSVHLEDLIPKSICSVEFVRRWIFPLYVLWLPRFMKKESVLASPSLKL